MAGDEYGVAMEEGEVFVDSLDDEDDPFDPDTTDGVDLELEKALTKEVEQVQQSLTGMVGEDELLTRIVRREIDSLREMLQAEIAELRKTIKGGSE